jgi:hypothetical protein
MRTSRGLLLGVAAGVAGTAVMTALEKVEQQLTGRPSSFVPAHTLERLLGLPHRADHERRVLNHVMHWGTGALVGTIRGVWAVTGIRGPLAHLKHSGFRLAFDQTLENATGIGAPPTTWPLREQLVDYGHKAVYALVTGLVADRMIAPVLESRRGRVSH